MITIKMLENGNDKATSIRIKATVILGIKPYCYQKNDNEHSALLGLINMAHGRL